MSRTDEVRRTLLEVIAGTPGADQFLLQNEMTVTAELGAVLLGAGEDVVARQLAGVTLRRIAAKGGAAELKNDILQFVNQCLAGKLAPQETKIALSACDVAAEILCKEGACELTHSIVKACAGMDSEVSLRLLHSLAVASGKGGGGASVSELLFSQFVFPFLESTCLVEAIARGRLSEVSNKIAVVRSVVTAKFSVAYRKQLAKSFVRFFFYGNSGPDTPASQVFLPQFNLDAFCQASPDNFSSTSLLRVLHQLPDPSILLECYPIVTNAMRVITMLTDDVSIFVFPFAAILLQHYARQCVNGAFDGTSYDYENCAGPGSVAECENFLGYYSKVTAIHSTLDAVVGYLSRLPIVPYRELVAGEEASPVTHPSLRIVDDFYKGTVVSLIKLLCLIDCEEIEAEEMGDCNVIVDLPSSLHCTLFWVVSMFLKDPDSGGVCPEHTGLPSVTSEAINLCLTASDVPMEIENSLFLLQKMCEAALLPTSFVPVRVLMFLINGSDGEVCNSHIAGFAEADRNKIKARGCIALSSIAGKTLPPEQHAHLIHLQCEQVACASSPTEIRVKSLLGLGRAVANAMKHNVRPTALQFVRQESITAMLPACLALVAQQPVLLIEAVDALLQAVPSFVITGQFMKPILDMFVLVLKQHETDTRLCARILRVFCQGVVDEHPRDGSLCPAVLEFASAVLQLVLHENASLTMSGLASSALSIISAMSKRECDCSAVVPQMAASVAGYRAERKEEVRAACRALSLSVVATCTRGGGVLSEPLASCCAQVCVHYAAADLDSFTQLYCAATCLCIASYLPVEHVAQLCATAVPFVLTRYAVKQDLSWGVGLSLLWPILLVKVVRASSEADVPKALAVLGATPESHVTFFRVWLSLDAVLEKKVRHISALAAAILLRALPAEYLSQAVQIEAVKTLKRYERWVSNILTFFGQKFRQGKIPLLPSKRRLFFTRLFFGKAFGCRM